MHLVVEGVTVDRQRLHDNEEPVNYSLERVLIFPFIFRQKCFKQHPICRFTEWCYTDPRCTCVLLTGMFQLTIDDSFLLKDELVQKSDEAVERFEYTY